jgi:hypothetical protein
MQRFRFAVNGLKASTRRADSWKNIGNKTQFIAAETFMFDIPEPKKLPNLLKDWHFNPSFGDEPDDWNFAGFCEDDWNDVDD